MTWGVQYKRRNALKTRANKLENMVNSGQPESQYSQEHFNTICVGKTKPAEQSVSAEQNLQKGLHICAGQTQPNTLSVIQKTYISPPRLTFHDKI